MFKYRKLNIQAKMRVKFESKRENLFLEVMLHLILEKFKLSIEVVLEIPRIKIIQFIFDPSYLKNYLYAQLKFFLKLMSRHIASFGFKI